MQTNSAERAVPAALMQEPPTLGEELDAAHADMLEALRTMLDHKAIYREQQAIASEARSRFFDSCTAFNAAQARVASVAREAQRVSA